ncbi:hypothetical protein TNCV_2304591 [Trichonephila clavipes]|nr:hypothetical protein TNCV_2304591 [Trichonephila clavipes]
MPVVRRTTKLSGTKSSFQMSPGSDCSILMAVYISGGSEETTWFQYRHKSLVSVVVPYRRGLPNALFQQDNVRRRCMSCSDLPRYIGYSNVTLAITVSRSVPIENI